MSYTITITKNEPITIKAGHEWKQVGEAPLYPDRPEQAAIKKDVYGYTPEFDKVVEQSREIFKQTVVEIDLASIVKAVNLLP